MYRLAHLALLLAIAMIIWDHKEDDGRYIRGTVEARVKETVGVNSGFGGLDVNVTNLPTLPIYTWTDFRTNRMKEAIGVKVMD